MKKLMIAVALSAFAMPAFAQQTPYETIDTDGNSQVSPEEAKVVWPNMTDDEWKAADLNGDGWLTKEEAANMGKGG